MISLRNARWRVACALLVPLLLPSYLALRQLDGAAVWDDEAFTAIIGKNLLETGTLTGWDGRNLWGYRNGSTLNADLRPINPPLDSLVAAASFRVFGVSTWSARFPFAVLGLLGLGLLVWTLQQELGVRPWLWFYVLASVGLSVNFLLPIRQCRYYALVLLLSLGLYASYRQFLRTRRWRDVGLMALSAVLLFYAHFMLCVVFVLALALVHVALHRREVGWEQWPKIGIAMASALALTVPYGIALRLWDRPDLQFHDPWYWRKIKLLGWHLRELNTAGFLPWMLLLAGGLLLYMARHRQRETVRVAVEWALLGLCNVLLLALFAPTPTSLAKLADTRYFVASLPFLSGAVGLACFVGHQHGRAIVWIMLGIFLGTNLLSATVPDWQPGGWAPRWLLPAYVREIHADYPTSTSKVVELLDRRARAGETYYALPEHMNYPVLFYVGDRLRLCCVIGPETPLPRQTLERLDAPIFVDRHFPDWLIGFGNPPLIQRALAYFSRPHDEGGTVLRQQYELVEALDVYWEQTQRPEMPQHQFGPVERYRKDVDAVYVYRRKAE